LAYFKDRLQIGHISKDVARLTKLINKSNLVNKKMKNKIFSLRKKRIKYLDKSLKKTSDEILEILK
jgi:hypothetical protein